MKLTCVGYKEFTRNRKMVGGWGPPPRNIFFQKKVETVEKSMKSRTWIGVF